MCKNVSCSAETKVEHFESFKKFVYTKSTQNITKETPYQWCNLMEQHDFGAFFLQLGKGALLR